MGAGKEMNSEHVKACLNACLSAGDLKKPSDFHVDLHVAHRSTVIRDR